ncbi:MAG: DUF4173 domain-containing protein [Candidatus Dormiibacterota bacterium]
MGQLSPDGRWRWDGAAWKPATDSAFPAWANLKLRSRASWLTLGCVVLIGLLADQALRVGVFGLAASVTFVSAAVILMLAGRLERIESRILIVLAGIFAAWFTLRASPWLLWPDLFVSAALMGLAASFAVRGALFDLGIAELAARAVNALLHASAGFGFVGRPVAETRWRFKSAAPLARGLLIATPIAVLLAVLLASADPVFASFFTLNVDFGPLVLDGVFVFGGSLWAAALLRLAASEPVERVDGPAWRLGAVESLVVLAVLDAVFAAFALAQVLAATGSADATLRSAGVTYADYARSGFFQLLWVSGITLVALVLFSRITGFTNRRHRIAFVILALAATALTLLIVGVAFERLSLYEQAYGFTMLRLYSHIFAVWIAVVFLLFAADLAGAGHRRRWFVGATSATALALLLALNFLNPEALVVALNTSHAQSAHKIDAQYLAELSSDATPALLSSRYELEPALRNQVDAAACAGSRSYSPSLPAFNWAEAEAAEARGTNC